MNGSIEILSEEVVRGGCMDSFVKLFSLGLLGIETVEVHYKEDDVVQDLTGANVPLVTYDRYTVLRIVRN